MERARSRARWDPQGGAGDGTGSPQEMREAELPVCQRPGSHESTVLSYKEGGKTKFLMLPAAEVEPVRKATQRFRTAKARLEQEGNAGLADLIARLGQSKKTD
jgi:hypothetical protein